MLNKEIELFEINIDINNYKSMDEKKLDYELIHKIKNYDKFANDNLIKTVNVIYPPTSTNVLQYFPSYKSWFTPYNNYYWIWHRIVRFDDV